MYFYLTLSVYFFWSWLIIPALSIAGAYRGSMRKGKPFYSTGDLVALLLLVSLGSFAIFLELLFSGAFEYFISPGALVQQPYISPFGTFVVTLATYVVLFAIFVLISFRLSRRSHTEMKSVPD